MLHWWLDCVSVSFTAFCGLVKGSALMSYPIGDSFGFVLWTNLRDVHVDMQLPKRSGTHIGCRLRADRTGRVEIESQNHRHRRNAFHVQGSTFQVSRRQCLIHILSFIPSSTCPYGQTMKVFRTSRCRLKRRQTTKTRYFYRSHFVQMSTCVSEAAYILSFYFKWF